VLWEDTNVSEVKGHHRHIRLYHPDKSFVDKQRIDLRHSIECQNTRILATKTGHMELVVAEATEIEVGIALGYGLDDQGPIPGGCWEFFSKPPRPERLWGPPSLLSNEYQRLFPWG
jgi:hypothetical protein